MLAEAFMRTCAEAPATDPENQKQSGNFKALDATLTTGLGKVLHRELGQPRNVLEEEAALRQEILGGEKTAWHAFSHLKPKRCEGVLLELKKLLRVEMRDDSLRASLTDWELVLCSLNEQPARDIQKSLYRRQLNKEESPKQTLAPYDHDKLKKYS